MTTGTGIISGVSVSHSDATVDQIEAAAADSQRAAVEALLDRPGVTEAFVLQTCNRVEAYVVADDASVGRDALATIHDRVDPGATRELDHEASLRHLMRVACGLESLVLGEDQIIGQVREAYEDARAAGGVGPTLDDALLKALHVGERARSETAINEGTVSLGSAAVDLVTDEHDLAEATAAVVGAGKMATLAARSLDDVVERVIVVNRTLPHAEHVAAELETEATATGLEALSAVAERADVVVSATGSRDPVVDPPTLESAGETVVVDLAQPRDVAPAAGDVESVTVHDLDDLESVTRETRRRRRHAAEAVEELIDEEFDHLIDQYKRKRADEVIAAMYEGAERLKARELRTAVGKLEADDDVELSEAHREVLESMADALVGQLLSAPTKSLRDAAENDDWSTINTALRLFDPAFVAGGAEHDDAPSIPEGPDGVPEEIRQQMPAAVLEQLAASNADDD